MKTLVDALNTPGVIHYDRYRCAHDATALIGKKILQPEGTSYLAGDFTPSELRQIAEHLDPQSLTVPGGWKLVPETVTPEMADAAWQAMYPQEAWNLWLSGVPAPPPLRTEAEVRREALEEAAKVAENACPVPPDGGSPTEEERAVSERAADAIRDLIGKDKSNASA
jgi:hypothetical protein